MALASCSQGNLDILGMVYTKAEGADERFAQSMEYNEQHAIAPIQVASDDYKLYVMTDIHVDYTTFNLDTFVMDYLADADAAPFCLLLGDLINSVNHYDTCMAHVNRINDGAHRCFSTLGNHDMYYDQWKIYRKFWGTSTYDFVVQTPSCRDLYICLDSGDGTIGKDQRHWLENLLREESGKDYRHIIVYTHTHFFKIDASQGHTSNFALEEVYELCDLFSRYGVDMVLQGHSHSRNLTVFKGVQYLRLDALEDHYYNAFYTTLQVGKDINWSFVPVGPQDPAKFAVRVPGVPF